MAIDGIGRPRVGNLPAPSAEEVASGTAASGARGPEKLAASSVQAPELSALERGELTVDQYLDRQVEVAAQHLEGRLSGDQLAFVKESLRSALQEDPVLMDLVRRVTSGIAGELK
ncbi:MAG: hypothetical protein SFV15_04020 [Polyangiaceae bacterium]|nr:hypothetical protein [Polyangiaceae bacterium]